MAVSKFKAIGHVYLTERKRRLHDGGANLTPWYPLSSPIVCEFRHSRQTLPFDFMTSCAERNRLLGRLLRPLIAGDCHDP